MVRSISAERTSSKAMVDSRGSSPDGSNQSAKSSRIRIVERKVRSLNSICTSTAHPVIVVKVFQTQYPPNSMPTDITLSQFLSIQEKGVSAWSFEPDYESLPNTLVHARTELTFLPDPSTASAVQSNLPLPKLNEVYYWEVKMFDLPPATNVSIGLATKPYPTFRLPGHARYSIAYHSSGDKSWNWPFTSQTYGPPLKEGDVLGVGYRPRTGAVFFTRNGRKMEDAFVGMNRWNLFPTVGADGPCSVHVNLGQAGFVHIEANVKKWGLAPSVGTLAPPPAYGSERGSILLEAGAGTPRAGGAGPLARGGRRSRRSLRTPGLGTSVPATSSPLRSGIASPTPTPDPIAGPSSSASSARYISPTDAAYHGPPAVEARLPPPSPTDSEVSLASDTPLIQEREQDPDPEPEPEVIPASSSSNLNLSMDNPPTPHVSDIHLRTLNGTHSRHASASGSGTPTRGRREHARSSSTPGHFLRPPPSEGSSGVAPPAYSPLDAFAYPDGVAIDLPAEMIAAALEGPSATASPGRR